MIRPFCAALAAVALFSSGAESRPFTPRDLATMDRTSEPRVSPDGRWVAYNVRSTDWEANRAVHALWLIDRRTPGAAPRRLRDGETGPTTARWSRDGTQIYFLSAKSGSTQVWRMDLAGGAAQAVTDLPLDVMAFRITPDGRRLVAALDAYPDCADLACSRARKDAELASKASGQVFDGTAPRFFDVYEDARFTHLFVVTLGDRPAQAGTAVAPGMKADLLDRPPGGDSDFAVSDREVIFAARPSGVDFGDTRPASLYAAPLDGAAPARKLDAASATSDMKPALSPDGRTLAYLAEDGPFATGAPVQLKVRDVSGGQARVLADGQALSFSRIAWSRDGRRLYGAAETRGAVRLIAIDPASGALKPLTQDGAVSDFDAYEGGLVYARDALDSPVELYDLGSGKARRLTAGASLRETPMSKMEVFTFAGWNGETVQGYVLKPQDWKPGVKYPVAFIIHGGPHGSFGDTWSYRWNPQVWASRGYAVVTVDFHGSSGYGAAFAQSIHQHWGDRPLEDLQKGWAHALAAYDWLDGERACALGGSYGGYMVNWIAGTWSGPWKCLVNHAGLFDLRTFAYTTDITKWTEVEFGDQPWKDAAGIVKFNPADKVDAWDKPMMVIHGARDYRVPLEQGLAAYGALRRRGLPSQFVYYPDENHWVLRPQNLVQWWDAKAAWVDRWIGPDARPAP